MKKKTINKAVFARRLTHLMEKHGETTYSMADRFSLSPATISRYMNGQMAAKITTIELMAKFFNVNPVWLMGFNVEKEMPISLMQIKLTEHECEVITAYRNQQEMQPAIDRLLGITVEDKHEGISPDLVSDIIYPDYESKATILKIAQESEEYKKD